MTTRLRAADLNTHLLWVGLLVTVVFSYLAVRDADFDEVGAALRAMNYWWLVPGLGMLALAILIRALRWRFLFAPETRPSMRAATAALLLGYFFNNILPARAGELARVVALHQRARTSRAETVATVVIERAFDVLSLLVLLFLALPWLPPTSWFGAAAVFAAVLAVLLGVVIVVLALYGARPVRRVLRPLARLPLVSEERVERAAHDVLQGFASIRSVGLGIAAFLMTTVSWLVMAVSFWFVMLGFDLGLSPVAGLLVVIAIGLAMILPSAPAAVGVFEAATLVALSAYGVGRASALSYALVLHALNFVPFLVVGALVLYMHASAVRRMARIGAVRERARAEA